MKTSLSKIINEESEFYVAQLRALGAVSGFDIFGFNVYGFNVYGVTDEIIPLDFHPKRATFQKFQTITGNIDDAILIATNCLSDEINVLDKWHISVDVVASNIDDFPVEYLRKFKPIKDIFIMELSELRQSAEEFLSRGKMFEENMDIEN